MSFLTQYNIMFYDPHNKCTKKFWKYINSMRKDQVSINKSQCQSYFKWDGWSFHLGFSANLFWEEL